MRITSKGQVTIPQHIRERLGLLPDTEVEFEIDGDTVRLRKAGRASGRGKRLVEHMRGRLRTGMSTDELMALTRGPFDDVDGPRR
jgi:AbrB family looped-hinge helix DNA binding protein